MKNKKVRLAIISSILLVLLVTVLCTTTLMRLREVNVQFVSTPIFLSQSDSELIVDSGEFEFGSNLLFTKYNKNVEKIERSIPYAKVIKFERKFPNKGIIHIEERTPVFKIFNSTYDQYSVYDKELKVLHVAHQNFLHEATGETAVPVLIFDESFKQSVNLNISAGNFLENEMLRNWSVAIADGTFNYNANLTTIMSQIVLGKMDGNNTFKIIFDNNITAIIIGDNNLQDKVFNAVKLFTEVGSQYANYNILITYDGVISGQPA